MYFCVSGVEWGDTDTTSEELGVVSNAVRTQRVTSCVRRHVTRYVTYTKILPRGEYFCVVLGGGHFRSVTDSRQKVTEPFHIDHDTAF